MKKIVFVFLSFWLVELQARVCSLDEIRRIDIRRTGAQYSPYPMMTKSLLMGDLLSVAARLDSSGGENNTFWTVTFLGLGGWFYFGLKSLESPDCIDDRTGARFYRPTREELLRFHHQEKDLFWRTYTWSGIWMAGVLLTTKFSERQTAAAIAMALPWAFSFSRRWSAFSEDDELQVRLIPTFQKGEWAYHSVLNLRF